MFMDEFGGGYNEEPRADEIDTTGVSEILPRLSVKALSPSTRKQLGIYWNKFIESDYSVSYSGLRDWLIDINLSSSSKKSISGSLARMMYTYELLSKDEYRQTKV